MEKLTVMNGYVAERWVSAEEISGLVGQWRLAASMVEENSASSPEAIEAAKQFKAQADVVEARGAYWQGEMGFNTHKIAVEHCVKQPNEGFGWRVVKADFPAGGEGKWWGYKFVGTAWINN